MNARIEKVSSVSLSGLRASPTRRPGVWRRWPRIALDSLLLFVVIVAPATSLAANYPLELVYPREAGTAPAQGSPAISASHRVFRAYPGLEYNVRAAVIGGAYPYTFTLANAPAGMTINERSGLITWANPQANASPTITVRDSEGAQASSTWNIAVTTQGFRFVDSVNGTNASGNGCSANCGTGTAANPWRTIRDMWGTTGAGPGEFVYFRRGTYRVTDLARDRIGTAWERVEFSSAEKPVVWLAYPGEAPLIDFSYQPGVEAGPLVRFVGSNTWIDGFETTRSHIIGFQFQSGPSDHYITFRRLRMHDHSEPGANNDGSNASFIMTTQSYGLWSKYMVIQDNVFYRAPADLAVKIYSQHKMLVEDNIYHDVVAGIEVKADVPQFTLRNNVFYNVSSIAIGGNMDEGTTSGEINFNLVRNTSIWALDVNQNGTARRIDIYRNTFVGRVRVRNTDSLDGPFNFYNNVIVNGDGGNRVVYESVSAPAQVTYRDNLTGSSATGIVDSLGALTSGYAQFVGLRGYQTGSTGPTPSAPTLRTR